MNDKERLTLDSLNRLEHKVDKINDRTCNVTEALAKQGAILHENTLDIKEHIKRTDKIEDRLAEVVRKVTILWNGPKMIIGLLTTISVVTGLIFTLHKLGVLNW